MILPHECYKKVCYLVTGIEMSNKLFRAVISKCFTPPIIAQNKWRKELKRIMSINYYLTWKKTILSHLKPFLLYIKWNIPRYIRYLVFQEYEL